jgi:hypothetical protein
MTDRRQPAHLTAVDLAGPVMCGLAGLLLVSGLAVELDSTAAKVLMVAAAVLFVPGAVLTLAFVRRHLGPPR